MIMLHRLAIGGTILALAGTVAVCVFSVVALSFS